MASLLALLGFEHDGVSVRLRPGDVYSGANLVSYADTADDNVAALERDVRAGARWRDAVHSRLSPISPWLDRIVTFPGRDLFFRSFDLSVSDRVLDVGSGWGQLAVPLAGRAQVCSLEPKRPKITFQQAIAQQEGVLDRLWLINADYRSIQFDDPFQVIILNGVLEWVGLYSEGDPYGAQCNFLRKAHAELAPGGRCVIGIENRIGLKYLLGAPDDHTGLPFVSLYDRSLAASMFREKVGRELRMYTYTLAEYYGMLRTAGFERLEAFAAFPDYKIPAAILPVADPAAVSRFILGGGLVDEHSGADGSTLPFQPQLRSLYQSLAELGIAQYFAPSYYLVAFRK